MDGFHISVNNALKFRDLETEPANHAKGGELQTDIEQGMRMRIESGG